MEPIRPAVGASLLNRISTPRIDKTAVISFSKSPLPGPKRTATAIVSCEGSFGALDGKTANGLVRHSERYKILPVVDSEKVDQNTGVVLSNRPTAIPICHDLVDCLACYKDANPAPLPAPLLLLLEALRCLFRRAARTHSIT